MTMVWFIPLGLAIGVAGTQTARKSRHLMKSNHLIKSNTKERTWLLLVLLAWSPSFCWLLAQFIDQY